MQCCWWVPAAGNSGMFTRFYFGECLAGAQHSKAPTLTCWRLWVLRTNGGPCAATRHRPDWVEGEPAWDSEQATAGPVLEWSTPARTSAFRDHEVYCSQSSIPGSQAESRGARIWVTRCTDLSHEVHGSGSRGLRHLRVSHPRGASVL